MAYDLKLPICFGALLILVSFISANAIAQEKHNAKVQPIDWWRFEGVVEVPLKESAAGETKPRAASDDYPATSSHALTSDEMCGASDDVFGYHKLVRGVSNNALRLGGINSYVVRNAKFAFPTEGPFAVEAWLALGSYPVESCPILAQADADRGVEFYVDAMGHLGLRLAIEGHWVNVVADEQIALNEWSQVACVYRTDNSVELYLNGKLIKHTQTTAKITQASDAHLLIGKSPIKRLPAGTMSPKSTGEVYSYFDGILDELKLYNTSLTSEEIAADYSELRPTEAPDLPPRHLPAGPAGAGPFGAFYMTLNYYDAWDDQWRIGEDADVVVRFADNPCRFVFWHGTGYIPHWVTENGIWFDDEFNETWAARGCHEPMSDKQCRHAQARILETNDARAVVHWRYALVDNWYEFAHIDELTGWGDWTDEVYTVFPDGVAVRQGTLRSVNPRSPHEWHESIVVMSPGQRPEDVLEPGALTLINEDGENHTYDWQKGIPASAPLPVHANAQITNTRSEYKPFFGVSAKAAPDIAIFQGTVRKDFSIFPWWNHWPTNLDPSDGRFALATDRASHCSLSNCSWNAYRETSTTMTKLMLVGLTKRSPEDVARLMRSWDSPPKMSVESDGFAGGEYDPAKRAYLIRHSSPDERSPLTLSLDASERSPIQNLSLVISGWQATGASVTAGDKPLQCRTARRVGLGGTDLIVWIECETTAPTSITITPND